MSERRERTGRREHRAPDAAHRAASSVLLGATLSLCLYAACGEPPAPPPAGEAHDLEGTWEGDGDSGPASLTIVGDSLYFYARPDFQYDATFTLVEDAEPPRLHATILDSPRTTDSAGELVVALYELVDGTLTLAVVDESGGEPASFDDAIARYRFERVPAGR